MSGAENTVTLELGAALAGRPLPTTTYKSSLGLGAFILRTGSQNIPKMAWAVALLRGEGGAREAWLRILKAERSQWMGSEICSYIYGLWHLIPTASVSAWAHEQGDRELAQLADEWLLFWFCLAELCRAPDGQIIWPGLRSAGHAPAAGWREYAQAVAMNRQEEIPKWLEAGHQAGLGMKQSWMWGALAKLEPTLRAAAAPLAAARDPFPWRLLPRLGLMTTLDVVVTEGGVIAWLGADLNANTPAWMVLSWNAGKLDCLPPEGGARIREQADATEVDVEDAAGAVHALAVAGDVLHYHSSLYGTGRLPLPSGMIVNEITLPGSGAPSVLMAPPTSPGSNAAGEAPPALNAAEREAIASGISRLTLPRSQGELQTRITASLRNGPLTSSQAENLADQVAGFAIGNAQTQAKLWQQLVNKLRGE